MRFSEDAALPERLNAEEKGILEGVFDLTSADSPLRRALKMLGLKFRHPTVLHWREDQIPYLNWSAWMEMISSGWLCIEPSAAREISYRSKSALIRLPSLIKSQLKIDHWTLKLLEMPVEEMGDPNSRITYSLMLGIGIQALMLRLPKHDPRALAEWLANPGQAPASAAAVVERIKKIQLKRTELSSTWETLFPSRDHLEPGSQNVPPWFWDDQPQEQHLAHAHLPSSGMPVCPGRRRGRAIWIDLRNPVQVTRSQEPWIAVFSHARPATVEHFGGAAALVFAEGGALSHACTVARERGIPAVTGVGRAILEQIRNSPGCWITVDGSTGEVILE